MFLIEENIKIALENKTKAEAGGATNWITFVIKKKKERRGVSVMLFDSIWDLWRKKNNHKVHLFTFTD